jgi:hypothetical protein
MKTQTVLPNDLVGNQEAHISRGPSKIRDRDKAPKLPGGGSNPARSGGTRYENWRDSRAIPKRICRKFIG